MHCYVSHILLLYTRTHKAQFEGRIFARDFSVYVGDCVRFWYSDGNAIMLLSVSTQPPRLVYLALDRQFICPAPRLEGLGDQSGLALL